MKDVNLSILSDYLLIDPKVLEKNVVYSITYTKNKYPNAFTFIKNNTEDIFQEINLILLQNAEKIKNIQDSKAKSNYIITIIVNFLKDYIFKYYTLCRLPSHRRKKDNQTVVNYMANANYYDIYSLRNVLQKDYDDDDLTQKIHRVLLNSEYDIKEYRQICKALGMKVKRIKEIAKEIKAKLKTNRTYTERQVQKIIFKAYYPYLHKFLAIARRILTPKVMKEILGVTWKKYRDILVGVEILEIETLKKLLQEVYYYMKYYYVNTEIKVRKENIKLQKIVELFKLLQQEQKLKVENKNFVYAG